MEWERKEWQIDILPFGSSLVPTYPCRMANIVGKKKREESKKIKREKGEKVARFPRNEPSIVCFCSDSYSDGGGAIL